MKDQLIINGHEIAGRLPLFITKLRQAIRDDRKTMTRRVITNPEQWMIEDIGDEFIVEDEYGDKINVIEYCKYKPGDIRVMTEPLINVNGSAWYQDDNEHVFHNQTNRPVPWRWKVDVLSSMFMSYEAARTLCRITDVRVERVKDITVEDIISEGVQVPVNNGKFLLNLNNGVTEYLPKKRVLYISSQEIIRAYFAQLFDSINAKRGYSWESNPWVCVVTFERVDR